MPLPAAAVVSVPAPVVAGAPEVPVEAAVVVAAAVVAEPAAVVGGPAEVVAGPAAVVVTAAAVEAVEVDVLVLLPHDAAVNDTPTVNASAVRYFFCNTLLLSPG